MSDNEKQPLRISMAGKKVSEMTAQERDFLIKSFSSDLKASLK
jgi:hypothetical protein